MRTLKVITVTLAGLGFMGLSACSSNVKPVSQSVGSFKGDQNAVYAPAVNTAKVQTKVIHQYIPVPVPGQLMPKPGSSTQSVTVGTPNVQESATTSTSATQSSKSSTSTKNTSKDSQKAVDSANQKATRLPMVHDFFNAMMTYNFMPGAMYTIYAAPLRLTDIALQQGEKIISIAAGDTLRWQISQTYSGAGETLRQHVIIKPNSSGLHNTMLITTNRRVYHLILDSTTNNTYMVSVRWHYADSPLTFVSSRAQGYGAGGAPGVSSASASGANPFKLDLSRLNFAYAFGMVKGNKPSWYPTRVFNDGRQTFIQFPKNFYRSDLPVLYVSQNGSKYGTMVNWRLKGNYMIVDQVIQKARLQSGVKSKKNQIIVQIQHT